jgi:hypothetical protein
MRYLHAAFLATAAIGLTAIAAPASAEVVITPDGHYYRLVPLRGPSPRNGARDGDGHTWPSDSERRQLFQLPADQLSERRISTGIHGRVRSIRQTIVKPGRRLQMFAAPFFETPN